ncbi:Fis family transcriptional regulator [Thiorhodococcus mannitoliphagus]|uniref:Putative Fis-like DNA-binding protein n=1 Tax=Thiorhodococcus mannitoliphagus TaxID=329406 RepID=A0A6P1DQ38_9GAMM|nr:helix-turn-helix domain-containing protein [Thiorhodococcus mannitoliphagus]NEX20387.1 Fis family transcriptional regulator [Thiorhodococcus mannitoliphagus]
MRAEAARQAPKTAATGLTISDADRTDPLSKCVREALGSYLENMADHEIKGLYRLVMEEVERPLFETVLEHTKGNLSHAAKILGMTRNTLRKRLSDYGIER